MNYITKLQADINANNAANAARAERFQQMREHLALPKYQPQANGERGDWIAVADVQRWLRYLEHGDHT